MNETIISNWNSVVRPKDIVYHLGDFIYGLNKKKSIIFAEKILCQLNGKIHLILGNHDKFAKHINGFSSIQPYLEIKVPFEYKNRFITLMHYAMRTWNHRGRGSWHLYGHSHGTLPSVVNSRSLDVGVDVWNFTPVSLGRIYKEMKRIDVELDKK